MNSGFWKAKSGKTSLAARTAHSKSVQICPVLEKSAWACSSHWSLDFCYQNFLTEEGAEFCFWWNVESVIFLSCQTLLIQALRWFLSLNLVLGQMGKWCNFVPGKPGSILLREGKFYMVQKAEDALRVFTQVSDTEGGYYIPSLIRCHAFCFLRCCFLKVSHNLIQSYNFIVLKLYESTFTIWNTYVCKSWYISKWLVKFFGY